MHTWSFGVFSSPAVNVLVILASSRGQRELFWVGTFLSERFVVHPVIRLYREGAVVEPVAVRGVG